MELRADSFVAYLQAEDSTTIVGYSSDSYNCPLARWVEKLLERKVVEGDMREVVVSSASIDVFVEAWREYELLFSLPLPEWGDRFIKEIDSEDKDNRPVTARQALEVMEHVMAPVRSVSEV